MYWTRYFYWLFRWVLALPVAILWLSFCAGIVLFDRVFGTADDYGMDLDWDDVREVLAYLFTMKLKR